MKHLLAYLLILIPCFAPVTARAQAIPSEQADTTSSTVPITYIYGNAGSLTPEALVRVRRRIAQLSTRGTTQRIIYPILVILPQGEEESPTSIPPVLLPTQPPAVSPNEQRTRPDINQVEDTRTHRPDERLDVRNEPPPDRDTTRAINEPRQDRDTTFVRNEPRQEQDTTRTVTTEPPVETVEAVLLETGLFSTTAVIFPFGRETLLPLSESILDTIGDVLVRHPALRVEVAGHTDNVGSETYNQQLSEERAQAVRQYLLSRFDIASDRIEARGYGEAQPVASNDTITGRTLNRRVEFRLLNPPAASQPR